MDKALKQRLVGASVLVGLAVVILPMLFGGQPESGQEAKSIELPPRPQELEFETRRFPIGEQSEAQPSALPTPQENRVRRIEAPPRDIQQAPAQPATVTLNPAETVDAAPEDILAAVGDDAQEPVDTAAELAETPAPLVEDPVDSTDPAQPQSEPPIVSNTPAGRPTPPVTSGSPGGRYLVQVASFSSAANANRLADQLRGLSIPVVLDTVDSAAGSLHRVRVGPFAERPAAEQALDEMNRRFPDLKPRMVDLRPEDAAPMAQPSDPMVRWVVQVGSFADSANADKLVYQLRDSGYRAASERVTSNGQQSYKVRVGPELQRESAVLLKERIAREFGITGLVMSAE